MPQVILGFLLAAAVSAAGWRLEALTNSGALGATLVGGLVFGLGGPTWGAVLVAFFLSSTLLSFYHAERKTGADIGAKGRRRDLAQVLANGGVAASLAMAVGIVTRESPWYPFLTIAYFGALSVATADTWASELGMLSRQQPRLLTTGQPVPPGRSGGITTAGLLASLAGGAFLGLCAFGLIQIASLMTTGAWFLQDWFLIPVCATVGFGGSLLDSLLGARWQTLYKCPQCDTVTESAIHSCGSIARRISGFSWLDNDGVNFLATAFGAILAALLGRLFL
ncbi:MAG: DUF92 domain-containing protein [Caldilineales bacterium]|nr:DUF92 domain-containing protein [Caldilineales bacterium]